MDTVHPDTQKGNQLIGMARDSVAGQDQTTSRIRRDIRAKDGADAIKRELSDIRAICAALGLDKRAKRQSRGLFICCPRHDDCNPSCSVTLADDGVVRVKCFGCGFKGDVFTLIAAAKDLDARAQFPLVLVEASKLVKLMRTENAETAAFKKDGPWNAEARAAVSRMLLELCPLDAEPDVAEYLYLRGLLEEARLCGFGGLPSTPVAQARLVAEIVDRVGREVWMSSGFVIGHDQLTWGHHRLLIPWRTVDGAVAVLQRRRLGGAECGKYVFPAGTIIPEPFGAEKSAEIDGDTLLILVEGALDVLAARALLGRATQSVLVLGLPGVQHVRPEWLELARGREVRIGFDRDAAGDGAARHLAHHLHRAGARRVLRLRPPAGKDWCDQLLRRDVL